MYVLYVQDMDSIPGAALSWRVKLCVSKVVSQEHVVLSLLFSLPKHPAWPWEGAVRLDVAAQDDALLHEGKTLSVPQMNFRRS